MVKPFLLAGATAVPRVSKLPTYLKTPTFSGVSQLSHTATSPRNYSLRATTTQLAVSYAVMGLNLKWL